jgi:3-hydroxyisobutyrate dehydrogenase-like beta-hydroxyacid dehydrogenase
MGTRGRPLMPAPHTQLTGVGIVGLGRMGLPISRHIKDAGFPVVGFDLKRQARDQAAADGLLVVDSLEDLASAAPMVLVLVAGDDAVRAVVGGLLAAPSRPELVTICSSVTPTTVVELADQATAAEVLLCDCTMVRGEEGAQQGTLLVYCGGEDGALARIQPVLHAFTADIVAVGPVGHGQLVKLVNNLLLWSNIAAVAEAMRLAHALGLDYDRLHAALRLGSGNSFALETWRRPRPMPDVESDMERVLDMATRLDVPMLLAERVAVAMADVKRVKAQLPGGPEGSMAEFIERTGSPRPQHREQG